MLVRRVGTAQHSATVLLRKGSQLRSTLRCLLACTLCVLLPATGHAGPLGDALRDVSARQAATAAGKSRQGVWVGGIVLTVVGGVLIIAGGNRTRDVGPPCGEFGSSFFGPDCTEPDPNHALMGAGVAAAGAGVIMIVLGRNKSAPQITATPGKFTIRHSFKF